MTLKSVEIENHKATSTSGFRSTRRWTVLHGGDEM